MGMRLADGCRGVEVGHVSQPYVRFGDGIVAADGLPVYRGGHKAVNAGLPRGSEISDQPVVRDLECCSKCFLNSIKYRPVGMNSTSIISSRSVSAPTIICILIRNGPPRCPTLFR